MWIEGRLTLTMKKSTNGKRPPVSNTMNASHRPAWDWVTAVDMAGTAPSCPTATIGDSAAVRPLCHKAADAFRPMMRRMSDDPAGFYARLEVESAASPEAITAAFHRKARVLHPDIVETGNAEAFMWVKEAYDVLGHAERRAAYDRTARAMALSEPIATQTRPSANRGLRIYDVPVALWAGVGGLLCLASIMTIVELTRPPPPALPAVARPFAPSVPPVQAPPMAQMQVAMPAAGEATHFVLPARGTTVLWRRDAQRDGYVPAGHLADFTSVEALRLVQPHGLVEIRLADGGSGFVDAGRLALGDQVAAHRSYCIYNAGPSPENGVVTRAPRIG